MTKLLPLAVLAVLFVAADKPDADKKTDKDLLQGTWLITAAELNGEVQKEPVDKKATVTFKGDTFTASDHPDEKGTFKIDADKKTLDVTFSHAGETKTLLALYKLDGDTLTICFEKKKEKEYPKDLTSKEGNAVITLKRQKADDKKVDQAKLKVDLAQMKVLTIACETYKINTGEFPPDLETLAKPQPDGGKAYVEAKALKPAVGGAYKYDPAGANNKGLKPDIWVEIPNGKLGNWMKEVPVEEKKPEK